MAFDFYSPVSINAGQVPSTQSNFPVLASFTDNRFKTVGNGGHVRNANGFDIRPYTDSTLSTPIAGYELERYNASTGEVVMWVRVSSLTSSSTPFVLAYGNPSITTDGSTVTTWSNSFFGVYHLKDGTTLNVNDSSLLRVGTNHGATATAGKIDGGAGLVSASSQWILAFGTGNQTAAMTISAWVNLTSLPATYCVPIGSNQGSSNNYFEILEKSTGKLAVISGVTNSGTPADLRYDGTGSNTLSTGTWYYLAATYNSTSGLTGYVNGSSDKNVAANGDLSVSGSNAVNLQIGQDQFNAGLFVNGSVDEARWASVARSSDWITTEYNNQSSPSTFETLGTEVGAFGGLFTS